MCRPGMRPAVLIGIWPEAGEASHFCRKKLFFTLINKRLWISFLILQSFWLCHRSSSKLFFLTLSKNKFQQTCRTKLQANNNLESIYLSRTSLVANIFWKFTGLVGLSHLQPAIIHVILLGIWPEAGEAGRFYRKKPLTATGLEPTTT